MGDFRKVCFRAPKMPDPSGGPNAQDLCVFTNKWALWGQASISIACVEKKMDFCRKVRIARERR